MNTNDISLPPPSILLQKYPLCWGCGRDSKGKGRSIRHQGVAEVGSCTLHPMRAALVTLQRKKTPLPTVGWWDSRAKQNLCPLSQAKPWETQKDSRGQMAMGVPRQTGPQPCGELQSWRMSDMKESHRQKFKMSQRPPVWMASQRQKRRMVAVRKPVSMDNNRDQTGHLQYVAPRDTQNLDCDPEQRQGEALKSLG